MQCCTSGCVEIKHSFSNIRCAKEAKKQEKVGSFLKTAFNLIEIDVPRRKHALLVLPYSGLEFEDRTVFLCTCGGTLTKYCTGCSCMPLLGPQQAEDNLATVLLIELLDDLPRSSHLYQPFARGVLLLHPSQVAPVHIQPWL